LWGRWKGGGRKVLVKNITALFLWRLTYIFRGCCALLLMVLHFCTLRQNRFVVRSFAYNFNGWPRGVVRSGWVGGWWGCWKGGGRKVLVKNITALFLWRLTYIFRGCCALLCCAVDGTTILHALSKQICCEELCLQLRWMATCCYKKWVVGRMVRGVTWAVFGKKVEGGFWLKTLIHFTCGGSLLVCSVSCLSRWLYC
jgi:hypothetical protein